jgi:hypothetical protein
MSDCFSSSTSDSGVGMVEDIEQKDKISDGGTDKLKLTYEYLLQLPRKTSKVGLEVKIKKIVRCKSENCSCRLSIREKNPDESYVRVTSAKFEERIAMDESLINFMNIAETTAVNKAEFYGFDKKVFIENSSESEDISLVTQRPQKSMIVTGKYIPNTKFTDRRPSL